LSQFKLFAEVWKLSVEEAANKSMMGEWAGLCALRASRSCVWKLAFEERSVCVFHAYPSCSPHTPQDLKNRCCVWNE
jgi:hypothetical protein